MLQVQGAAHASNYLKLYQTITSPSYFIATQREYVYKCTVQKENSDQSYKKQILTSIIACELLIYKVLNLPDVGGSNTPSSIDARPLHILSQL